MLSPRSGGLTAVSSWVSRRAALLLAAAALAVACIAAAAAATGLYGRWLSQNQAAQSSVAAGETVLAPPGKYCLKWNIEKIVTSLG